MDLSPTKLVDDFSALPTSLNKEGKVSMNQQAEQ